MLEQTRWETLLLSPAGRLCGRCICHSRDARAASGVIGETMVVLYRTAAQPPIIPEADFRPGAWMTSPICREMAEAAGFGGGEYFITALYA